MIAGPALAADETASFSLVTVDGQLIERLDVIGSRERAQEIPGAAAYIGPEELKTFHYNDIHRVLRMVPGVNIQEEDGFGLRPNIGLRGTGIERSSRITLMEDGVLIAPAPYAAPAAYYFPTTGRLSAVEVRKGSSAVKFGPRTIGGAINLVSSRIPDAFGGRLKLRAGEDGMREAHATIGGERGPIGVLFETFQASHDGFKKLPGGGDTGFRIQDYLAKFRLTSGAQANYHQTFELKLGATDQRSNETYLGITDADFADTPFRRYAASANDQFNSQHYQLQASHFIQFNAEIDLTTVAYYNKFERDWFKLDDLDFGDGRGRIRPGVVFDDPSDPLNIAALAILRGDADSIDDALQLRHNAREYYSWGLQTLLHMNFLTGGAEHDLQLGLRYHEDQEDRLEHREKFRMEAGRLVLTSVDEPGSLSNRLARAEAFAAFIQDEMVWGRFRVVPGVRFEHIELARIDFSKSDPERLAGPTGSRSNQLDVIIPGLGIAYTASEGLTFLVGVHKGFSPPGPSQASADEEKSVNLEAGLRYSRGGFSFEAIGFYTRYSNLVGICSNAVGCTSGQIGDQFNGGRAGVKGLELSGSYLVALADGLTMPINFNYTFTEARFRSTFSDGFWGDVTAGDRLPYIPPHQAYASVGLEGLSWDLTFNLNFTAPTRNRAGSGPIPRLQRIDGRTVFDLAFGYDFGDRIRVFASIENLFDATYVVARRPYGPRPGKPRSFQAGLELSF